jgi:hypothetical protein
VDLLLVKAELLIVAVAFVLRYIAPPPLLPAVELLLVKVELLIVAVAFEPRDIAPPLDERALFKNSVSSIAKVGAPEKFKAPPLLSENMEWLIVTFLPVLVDKARPVVLEKIELVISSIIFGAEKLKRVEEILFEKVELLIFT